MFAATIFDYNGVLVDDEAVHLAAFREVLAPIGVSVSERDYWDRYIGFDDTAGFRAMLSDAGHAPTDDQVSRLVVAKRPVYMSLAQRQLKAFPGAAELVRRRAAAAPVAVVSGALRDEIELGLEYLGVKALIQSVISAEDTRASKPDPEGYLLGFERLKAMTSDLASERVLVIEDSLAGINAAKTAGMTCIGVAHSYSMEQLSSSRADLAVRDIAAIDDELLAKLYAKAHG